MLKKPQKKKVLSKLIPPKNRVAVIGSGSWATALVKILNDNNVRVLWYIRNPDVCQHIEEKRNNPNYLSAVYFKKRKLTLSASINAVIEAADIVFFAIPSIYLLQELNKLTVPLKGKVIVSAIKGVIPEKLTLIGTYFHETYQIRWDNIGVIAGPCHAEEIAMERLSYLTVASQNLLLAKTLSRLLANTYVRVKQSNDVIGIEYATMLKNVYAIAAGIAHGLNYGDNFQSVLMSNAIREMKRFIREVYRLKRDINNAAYLGDLLVTGYSIFSRNRTFGNMVGKGYGVRAAQLEMNMVAEGYFASKSAKRIANSFQTKTPIIDAVYSVLYERKKARKVFARLAKKLD